MSKSILCGQSRNQQPNHMSQVLCARQRRVQHSRTGHVGGLIACVGIAITLGACAIDPGNVAPSTKTETMTWDVTNSCRGSVDLRFFDETTRPTAPVWPSNSSSYLLDSGDQQSYKLNCKHECKHLLWRNAEDEHELLLGRRGR